MVHQLLLSRVPQRSLALWIALLQTISQEQAKFGSYQNRLNYSISNLSRASVMTEQALGRLWMLTLPKSHSFVEIPDPESGSNINASASEPVKVALLQLIQ